jgi:hypothetical protein
MPSDTRKPLALAVIGPSGVPNTLAPFPAVTVAVIRVMMKVPGTKVTL